MTKFEWERQLKKGISGLPKAEQQRVLDYYNELFADKIDAGLREQYIISEFGNPYDVANKILVDYYNGDKENPEVDAYIYSSSDEIDSAFDDDSDTRTVEAPRRKALTERRETRADEHFDDDESKSESKAKNSANKGEKSASGLIALLCILTYCVLGAVFNLWHPGWLIFLAIPCIITLIEAINKRNWKIFAYPVFATLVFLVLGFSKHMWHPAWIIFITIPIYYVLGNFITKNANGSKADKTGKTEKFERSEEQVREPERVETKKVVKHDKSDKRDKSTNAISIIAKVLMTICFVWVTVVVFSFVISLFCGGIGLIVGGVASLISAFAGSVDAFAIGLGLAQLGLGLICAFGMAALFKPCLKMCKALFRTAKNSFSGKEKE